jgi:hypothetical protein
VVTTSGAGSTVNILNTSARIGITVEDGGNDVINVGNSGGVQGILGDVAVMSTDLMQPHNCVLNIDDSADATARTVTLEATFTTGGQDGVSISGLAPASIGYGDIDVSSLNLTTGSAADTVNVLDTDVTTNLSTSGGNDVVNVGNDGIAWDIHGTLNIRNPNGSSTLNISNAEGVDPQTVTLSSFTSGGSSWDSITGLADAAINYEHGCTNNVNITTDADGSTINVRTTYADTRIVSLGADTINVGDSGNVQGIRGTLNIENPPHRDTIKVDDSADATARIVTLSTFVNPRDSQGSSDPWGAISGLAPADIFYEYADTSGVTIDTGTGGNTINVRATGAATSIVSAGHDTVHVGDSGNVQSIRGTLNIENPPSRSTITVDDSADATARTVTLSSFVNLGDSESDSDQWGKISGLAPTDINYEYADTSSVTVNTGTGGVTVNVQATGASTTIVNNASGDVVNVGNAGSVQAIHGDLTVENPPYHSTLNVDDSADAAARVVTLDTFTPAGDTSFGSITDLAPAAINYEYEDISELDLHTGTGGATFNVRATGVSTWIFNKASGDVVNVGNAGSVQDIRGDLTVDDLPSNTALNINDSADATARTVTLGNKSGNWEWGSITGLAPAEITYSTYGTASVSVTTGSAADTVNVLATTVTTNLSTSGGNDVVKVGDAGSVQAILGDLTVENGSHSGTLNVDDSADTTGRAVTLDTFTPAGDTPFGSITNLAPAAITYEQADILSPVTINGGSGGNTFTVASLPVQTIDLNTGGGNDMVKVQATSGSLVVNGQGGTNTLVGPNAAETWNITAANAGSVGVTTFSNVQKLTGGTSTDAFRFTAAGSVTGRVDGGGGTNTLDYSGDGGIAATVNLATNTATKTGGFANIQKLVGSSSAADTLIGPNAASTWIISGANSGTVGTFSFSAIEKLTGGTSTDAFKLTSAGSVSGKVDGGAGVNTLDYSGDGGAAVTVNLASSSASRTGGFAHIQKLVGSSSAADTLIGPNTTNTWTLTGANAGTVGAFSFSAVENLTGGSGLDLFIFSAGKSVSGKIDGGGGGNDWLDYAAYTTPVTVNLATNTATGVGGGIAHIPNVRGGQGGNTLTGNALGNILIGGAGSNTINGGTGRSLLIGGQGKDTVTGHSGGDILIAGSTSYDSSSLAHDLALESILAEWQSANSYATRIYNLKYGGGKNGSNKLIWGYTVHDNATANANKLTGGGGASGQNWFLANLTHTQTNKTPQEQLN